MAKPRRQHHGAPMAMIDCIADLHGYRPEMRGGDLLIIAGDLTARDDMKGWLDFYEWLNTSSERYKKVIYIAGNHDGALAEKPPPQINPKISYLCDSGTEFNGLKIWGSPYTPTFNNWYFMEKRGEAIRKHWDLIPNDTDILVTHGPPHGILDNVSESDKEEGAGCEELRKRVGEIKPKLHVFGHIHGAYGEVKHKNTRFINCSHVDENYRPVNSPVTLSISLTLHFSQTTVSRPTLFSFHS